MLEITGTFKLCISINLHFAKLIFFSRVDELNQIVKKKLKKNKFAVYMGIPCY